MLYGFTNDYGALIYADEPMNLGQVTMPSNPQCGPQRTPHRYVNRLFFRGVNRLCRGVYRVFGYEGSIGVIGGICNALCKAM